MVMSFSENPEASGARAILWVHSWLCKVAGRFDQIESGEPYFASRGTSCRRAAGFCPVKLSGMISTASTCPTEVSQCTGNDMAICSARINAHQLNPVWIFRTAPTHVDGIHYSSMENQPCRTGTLGIKLSASEPGHDNLVRTTQQSLALETLPSVGSGQAHTSSSVKSAARIGKDLVGPAGRSWFPGHGRRPWQ